MNVSENTINILYQLIEQSFVENRVLDRAVSVLGVEFAMNNTASLVHQHMAHLYPMISDEIGEKCLERYNISVEYGATPEGKENYLSVEDIINMLESRAIDFQNMLIGACKAIQENGDIHVYADLLDILEDFNPIVEQVILLKDKLKLYGNNYASFDAHIKEYFWILGD